MTSSLTAEELRPLVYERLEQPWCARAEWVKARGMNPNSLRRWRAMVLHGDLDRRQRPPKTPRMITDAGPEIVRMQQQMRALETENSRLALSNEALEKAIGLIRGYSVQEPEAPSP